MGEFKGSVRYKFSDVGSIPDSSVVFFTFFFLNIVILIVNANKLPCWKT